MGLVDGASSTKHGRLVKYGQYQDPGERLEDERRGLHVHWQLLLATNRADIPRHARLVQGRQPHHQRHRREGG